MTASHLRVAIVHYHARGGGVTRIMEHAARALEAHGSRAAILVGESSAHAPGLPLSVLPALAYAPLDRPVSAAPALASLEAAAAQLLGGPPDVWHVHNHSLGKNLLLPVLVEALAEKGAHLLLQIHDFAEDGRPANYRGLLAYLGAGERATLARRLYPQGPHIHYALLNARDRDFLAAAGIAPDRLHLLANPVHFEAIAEPAPPPHTERRLVLYPTRAIRRKNLGELLLWAALSPGDTDFATTLTPQNPEARVLHDAWVAFAQEQHLPVSFGAGETNPLSFPELLQTAHACITTSVAEGFGLAFLEPWLVRRPLVGRNLPEITREFEDAAVDLGGLYSRVEIPVAWVGSDDLRASVEEGLRLTFAAYGHALPPRAVDRALAAAARDDRVDFGRLDESLQRMVIRRVLADSAARNAIQPADLLEATPAPGVVLANDERIRSRYGLAGYGKRLHDLYAQIAGTAVGTAGPLDPERLLDLFLAPERFFLLRT